MSSRQIEFNKIKKYKENWYALIACICSEKPRSVTQSCKVLGVALKHENTVRMEYRVPRLDLDTVKKTYEEMGNVRQMAIKMDVCEPTLRKFMKVNGIMTKIKPKISDSFDINKIVELRKEGNNVRDISLITGYEYYNLDRFIRTMKKEGAFI